MNVRLASQTLRSKTVNVLRNYYGNNRPGTTTFCEKVYYSFDALNLRNTTS